MMIKNSKVKQMKTNLFKDQVVWITGASSGIGEALAYAFSRHGAKLILSSRNKKALERVKNNCTKSSSEAHVLALDLSKLKTLNDKAKQALNIYGRIDFMVHNAGVALRDLVVNTDIKIDKKIMDTNYFGTVVLTKAILGSMLKQKSGHFLVISSISGKCGVPKLSSYAASKHALHGFFESLRAEVAEDNINITMAVPGFIKTNITINALKGDGTRYGRMMRVQDRGLSPNQCAMRLLRVLIKNKEEVVIGGPEVFSILCKRFFPRFSSKLVRSHPMKRFYAVRDFLSLKRYVFKYEN